VVIDTSGVRIGYEVTVIVSRQPKPGVVKVMSAVLTDGAGPVTIPRTMPVMESTFIRLVSELDQIPNAESTMRGMVKPWHTDEGPVTVGPGLMVIGENT
jgi:hypothetical protein